MSQEQIRKIVEDSYDDSKEETLRAMARDFYSRRLLSTAILVWGWAIVFIALAAYSALQFFKADQTKEQIMFAALFILGAVTSLFNGRSTSFSGARQMIIGAAAAALTYAAGLFFGAAIS